MAQNAVYTPNDPKRCFRRSKITFGYGLACRPWRLRAQARSVSSRKESKQYFGGPECSSHSANDRKRSLRRSKITFGYGLACRLWRPRVQARSMSSRKESNRWPRTHSPSDPKRCFRRSKIAFGYGLACRLWRLRVQARSMSSRKESNRWPRTHSPSDPKRCFRRSKIAFGYGLACRLWRLRVQARSMSSRKESNRRMQFTLPE